MYYQRLEESMNGNIYFLCYLVASMVVVSSVSRSSEGDPTQMLGSPQKLIIAQSQWNNCRRHITKHLCFNNVSEIGRKRSISHNIWQRKCPFSSSDNLFHVWINHKKTTLFNWCQFPTISNYWFTHESHDLGELFFLSLSAVQNTVSIVFPI